MGKSTSEEYRRGFNDAKAQILDAVNAVPYRTRHQKDMYSEWEWTDRSGHDVKADCLAVVSGARPADDVVIPAGD